MSNVHEQDEYPPAGHGWYVVAVLTVAYIFSFIDRQILSLLVGPIQRDLKVTDTQMGLLGGLAFVVFYTLFGIPMGRLADTKSRRAIIGIGIALWSLMTAACGLTRNFFQLVLMRMGVGVGEATLSPAAYSLIADYFPPNRRSTAMSVYSMGIYIGSGLAFVLGGMIIQLAANQEGYVLPLIGSVRSWQLVFFAVGLPGLLVALLLLTVKEPTRKGGASRGGPSNLPVPVATVGETWAYVRDNRATFLFLNLGIALVTLNSYANSFWVPTMFARRFAWGLGNIGMVYGAIVAIAGTCGVVAGGRLADWWIQRGRADANVRVTWLACLAWLPSGLLYPLAPTGQIAALLLIPTIFFGSMPFGVAPAAIQRMMPNTMRAQATAIYLFVINLIGNGLGPYIVAILTEQVFQDKNSVHRSLWIVGAVSYLSAAVFLGLSLKSYRRSLDYLQRWSQSQEIITNQIAPQ
ncbi:MAG: MFS transporter [Planctomycetes bacterium SCN 63-9]|nr:MAG: MFS transporter [Planctomycetes bacterium SCN 63-9]